MKKFGTLLFSSTLALFLAPRVVAQSTKVHL